jgi:glutamine synthetase
MLAAILGAALTGIEDRIEPPAPVTGNAYAKELPQIPGSWAEAIDAFENSLIVERFLPRELIRNYVLTKRQELHYMTELNREEQVELYLDTV